MKAKQIFFAVFLFCTVYNTSFASVYNVYFETILEYIVGSKRKTQEKQFEIELPKSETMPNTQVTKDDENIFLDSEVNYPESQDKQEVVYEDEEEQVTEESTEVKKTTLGKMLDSIVSRFTQNTSKNSSPNKTATTPTLTSAPINTGGYTAPSYTSNLPQQPSFLNSLLNKGQNPSQNFSRPYSVPDSVGKYTPYVGPGGSLPGECGIPKGPWAYNIGGNGVSCDAGVVVTGYMSQLRGKFGAGYVNPLTEKGQSRPGSGAGNCANYSTAKQYGEGCFSSYASGAGQVYIQEQLLHWQAQGKAKGQKCVPVDIDNCDAIGSENYKNILDQVEKLNNQAEVKIKVLTKNPHLGGCNFFSHPAVIGAFIEEISPSEAQKVSQMRNKPEQILLFARGGGGSNQKLKQIENLKIPNSAYSYDQGGEYQNVVECTYNP